MSDNLLADRRLVLLFYREESHDKFLPYDRHIKSLIKPIYQRVLGREKTRGFGMSFELMRRALTRAGYEVRVNDYALARDAPTYPVGLVGSTHVLDGRDLDNPAILGPSLYDHPGLAPDLMRDPRFAKYLVLADWMRRMFEPVYGASCVSWFAGIDLEAWPDTRNRDKDIDILVYDKIYRERNVLEPLFLAPIRERLAARGLSTAEIRYGHHEQEAYRTLLGRSRGMLFLCEHETQGLAYQEALACNVPVIAWNRGFWTDPLQKVFEDQPVPASSIPFFSPECGTSFSKLSEFDVALTRFLDKRDTFEPRRFVAENLSMQRSADIYSREYFALAQ